MEEKTLLTELGVAIATLKTLALVAPRLRSLPAASLRDYRAGFPDRAGSYLLELVNQLLREPEYATAFSPAAKKRLQSCVMDLREL